MHVSKYKINVYGKILEEGFKKLSDFADISFYPENKLPGIDEFECQNKDTDAIVTWFTHKLDATYISKLKKTRVIANYAVGYDNIDIKAASSAGIIVLNTPDILTNATAETALLLTFACAKRMKESILRVMTQNLEDVSPSFMLGKDISGKTVGVIGAGRIGGKYAQMMHSLGCNILYHNRNHSQLLDDFGFRYTKLYDLLLESDIVSLHVPLTSETKNLLDCEKLSMMKDDAILINTSRAGVIDEEALISLLNKGKFFSVGLDVYNNEPYPDPRLLDFNRVILLPHIGSATYETRLRMAEFLSETIILALEGKITSLNNIVNKDLLESII